MDFKRKEPNEDQQTVRNCTSNQSKCIHVQCHVVDHFPCYHSFRFSVANSMHGRWSLEQFNSYCLLSLVEVYSVSTNTKHTFLRQSCLKPKALCDLALSILDTSFIHTAGPHYFLWLWCYDFHQFSLYIRRDICDESKNVPMCPRCDRGCPYWPLYDTCIYSKVGHSKFYSLQFNWTTFSLLQVKSEKGQLGSLEFIFTFRGYKARLQKVVIFSYPGNKL